MHKQQRFVLREYDWLIYLFTFSLKLHARFSFSEFSQFFFAPSFHISKMPGVRKRLVAQLRNEAHLSALLRRLMLLSYSFSPRLHATDLHSSILRCHLGDPWPKITPSATHQSRAQLQMQYSPCSTSFITYYLLHMHFHILFYFPYIFFQTSGCVSQSFVKHHREKTKLYSIMLCRPASQAASNVSRLERVLVSTVW